MQGNTIGLNTAGNPAPNTSHGLVLYGGAANNLIGGSGIGAANLIAGNASDGILLLDDTTTGNTFQRNSIFRSGAYGIQLATAHPPQSVPTLTSAQAGLATTVVGSLTSTASSSFLIEFFATPTGDASFTAGRYFLGETPATTNSGGMANFNVPLGARVPAGYLVTVTATNAAGSTSELSNTATVQAAVSTAGDGIPDAWKSLYGFSLSDPNLAGRDTDGTGMTNLQKFRAGLNPVDAAQLLTRHKRGAKRQRFQHHVPERERNRLSRGAPRRSWIEHEDAGGGPDPRHGLADRRDRSAGRAAATGLLSGRSPAVAGTCRKKAAARIDVRPPRYEKNTNLAQIRFLAAAGRILRIEVVYKVRVLLELLGNCQANLGIGAHLTHDRCGHIGVIAERVDIDGLGDGLVLGFGGCGGEHRTGDAYGEKRYSEFFHKWWCFWLRGHLALTRGQMSTH